jgi:hypothetical protein
VRLLKKRRAINNATPFGYILIKGNYLNFMIRLAVLKTVL